MVKGENRWEIWTGDEFNTVLIGATEEQAIAFRNENFPNAELRFSKSRGRCR